MDQRAVKWRVWDQVYTQVWRRVRRRVRSQIGNQVSNRILHQVRSQVGNQVSMWSLTRSPVWARVCEQAKEEIDGSKSS